MAGTGDDETIVVEPQDVAESGAGWVLSDDEETIDVDPELLRKLRSSPTVSDVDETIVADVSRLGASRSLESAPGSPEPGSRADGSSQRRLVPMWARVAVGLVAVAILVAAAVIAGWEPFSGDATTDSASSLSCHEFAGEDGVAHRTWVAFMSHSESPRPFVVDTYGDNLRPLTENIGNDWVFGWVPEGADVVFTSDRDGDYDVYVMNSDGSDVRQLTDNASEDWASGWVPEGADVVFTSDRDGDYDVYVMNSDGSDVRQLTDNASEDWAFGWVSEGADVVFTSDREGDFDVYVMNSDGGDVRKLTHGFSDGFVNALASPDKSRIAYGAGNELYIMDMNGSNVRQLADNSVVDYVIDWSPDGACLAIARDLDGDLSQAVSVLIMSADGTDVRQLVSENDFEIHNGLSPSE